MWIYLPDNLERFPCSQAWGDTHLDCALRDLTSEQSAMLSMTSMPSKSYSSDSEMSHPPSIPLQSGMTSTPSIPNPGEAMLTSSAPGSPVSLTATRDRGKASSTPEICGPRHGMSFGWWDPSGSCLRTFQASFLEMMDGNPMASRFWGNLPHWGSVTSDGEFIRHTRQALPISESGGLFWATPTSRDYKDSGPNTNYQHAAEKVRLAGQVVVRSQNEVGSLNPDWVEAHLMSLPEGWTRLEPLPEGAYEEWWDGMKDGIWWDTERDLPRLTKTRTARVNRLKMLGNGIVPASAALAIKDMSIW